MNTKIHTDIGDMALGYGKSEDFRVEFYESGAVKRFVIVNNYIDENGKQVSFSSKVSTGFGDVVLASNAIVNFYDSGSLLGYTPDELQMVQIAGLKVAIPAGTYLSFYPNGNICDFTSSNKLTVDIAGKKIEFEGRSKFRASEDGTKIINTPGFTFKRSDGYPFKLSSSDTVEVFYDDGTPKKINRYGQKGDGAPQWIDIGVRYYVDCDTMGKDDCLACFQIYYDRREARLTLVSSAYKKLYFLQKGDEAKNVGMVYFAKDGTPSSYALYKVDADGKRILDSVDRPIVDDANKKRFTKVE